MCGASEQCRLAPLVRAGVWMHFCTWQQANDNIENTVPETTFHNQFQRFFIDPEADGIAFNMFLRQFSIIRSSPANQRIELLNNSRKFAVQIAHSQNLTLVNRATELIRFAGKQLVAGNTHNIALSLHSKVHAFFLLKHWCIFDTFAREGLGIGAHQAGFTLFYIRLQDLGFCDLSDELRTREMIDLSLWPERIIDKMLWVLGSGNANELCHEAGANLAGANLEQQNPLNQLANQITPIICRSPLGQHLLQRLDEMYPAP